MTAFMYSKELESIKKYGFIDPITVVEAGPGRYVIVDGEHRWKAARDLGMGAIPATILDGLDPNDLPKLTIVLNELKGQADPERLADVLANLLANQSIEELIIGLPYTEDILKGYLGFRDLKLPPKLEPAARPEPTIAKEPWVERLFRIPKSFEYLLDQAIEKVKTDEFAATGQTITDWQALERIVAEYMAS